MTDLERQQVLTMVEKGPHQSKKFIAWILQQVIMGSMAIVALITQPELGWPLTSYMLGIVFMMGASTMWYLGKQAALDATVRGFAMVGNAVTPPADSPQPKESVVLGRSKTT